MAATPSPQYNEWVVGTEIDHVNAAITHLQASLPEWTPRPSAPEVTLLEAFAVILGPVALGYQSVEPRVIRHLMEYYNVVPHDGFPATGKARFRVSTGTPEVTIPTGTLLRYTTDTGALDFRTTETVTVLTSESLQVDAYIEATENGTAHNGIPAGSRLDSVDYLLQVESISVVEYTLGGVTFRETRGGQDPETDASFDERAMAAIGRQTTTLVLPTQFRDAVVSREEVGRATVLDRYDPDTGSAEAVGHVTVAVTDNNGLPLTTAQTTELQGWVASQALSSLLVHVVPPTYTTVDLAVTVEAAPGFDYSEVEAGVTAALEAFLDPMSWAWWSTITAYDLVSVIDDVAGVGRVVTVPGPISLAGAAPLPTKGTISVTVNAPTREV